jgi:hypothetical protein
VLAHCWVHVRREFVEIEKSFPTACREILCARRLDDGVIHRHDDGHHFGAPVDRT